MRFLVAIAALLALAGCAAQQPPQQSSVCASVAKVKAAPDAATLLAGIDPHSAFGVVWSEVDASCQGAAPVAGVDPTWQANVWAMVKALAPVVLPIILGLL